MRLACIAIGSNAIRMLSAEWDGQALCGVIRERRGTRLFSGLRDGYLTDESMRSSVDAVAELAGLARQSGAQEIFLFATSAARDAKNGSVFAGRCEAACGAVPEIISGEEEARLSYLGACGNEPSGVIDIGGGSTELTIGEDGVPAKAVSLQMGAVRYSCLEAVTDEAGYERARERAMALLLDKAPGWEKEASGRIWTGVGGTMTTLGAMQRGIPLFDSDTCESMGMTRREIARWGRRLAAMPMEERRHTTGLMPHRADIIPAGIAILDAVMTTLSIGVLRLSAQGNMDGYLKKKFRQMG